MRAALGLIAVLAAFAPAAAAQEKAEANPAIISSAAAAEGPVVHAVAPKDLIGREVTNRDDVGMGEIEAVRVDAKGNIRQVIVGVGTFLGVGERNVAVDWKDMLVSENGRKLALNASKEQLAGMPAYNFADPADQGTVFGDTEKPMGETQK